MSKDRSGVITPNNFTVRIFLAVDQPIPHNCVFWNRENLVLFGRGQETDGETSEGAKHNPNQQVLPLLR